ncbi:MAG: arylamine N-acetyltransferase family protein [Trebonia sp.]
MTVRLPSGNGKIPEANGKTPEAVDRYLSRLGFAARPEPTVSGLAELQRRHLDSVPYENLAVMLGRPDSCDPEQTLERIAAGGNAGYCFQHNGAFEVVLRALGFAVERRFGHVRGREVPPLNHLALLVTIGGRSWWPDLGLGDALRDPVEVVTGEIRQGPFRYEITDAGAGEWTFRHDPAAGSFGALDVRAARPADAEIAAAHRVLTTPPEGRFTRVLVVQRRDDTGAEVLRGIRYQRTGDGAFARDLASYGDWRSVLESLGVSLAGAGGGELRSLHARMLAVHAEWAAARLAAGGDGAGSDGASGR